jgi:4-hydroxy-tetrahydrodipicolinate synthase
MFAVAEWGKPGADARHQQVDVVRTLMQKTNMIPALKYVTATFARDPEWRRVRPPLDTMGDAAGAAVVEQLRGVGFAMPGWG